MILWKSFCYHVGMSLDMFLTKNTYVGSSGTTLKISGTKSRIQIPRFKHITEEIAYWRKANAIHKWFVETVQDGTDDNRQYDVTKDQPKELLNRCKTVLEHPDQAEQLLPTQEGFLFGSTEYDDQYFQNLDYTATTLDKALKEPEDRLQVYIYQSDW